MAFRSSILGSGGILVRDRIRSRNYVFGVSGFAIERDNYTQFENVHIGVSNGHILLVTQTGGAASPGIQLISDKVRLPSLPTKGIEGQIIRLDTTGNADELFMFVPAEIELESTSETVIGSRVTNHNIVLPSTIAADRDIEVICSTQESVANDPGAPTTPTGYAQRYSLWDGVAFRPHVTKVHKRTTDTSDGGATVNINFSVATETHIVARVWKNVHATTPYDTTQTVSYGNNNPNPPALTTVTDNAMVTADVVGNRGAGTLTATISTGYTEDFNQVPDISALIVTSKLVAVAGAENPGAWTWTVDNSTAITDALRPAA